MKNIQDILIGSHVSMKGPKFLVGSLTEALSYGANCFMIYTGPNQSTLRTDTERLKIDEFHKLIAKANIPLEHVIVHAPYILNLATIDPSKYRFSIEFLTKELARVEAIGAKYLVLHPGNAINTTRKDGMDSIVKAINQIYEKHDFNVVLCLETMAGKGNELGNSFEEISYMLNNIKNKKKIGVCLDTCHISDAGYDINQFDQILNQFDKIVGLKWLKVMHINDSMNPRGARKDRHQNLGYGEIGFEVINYVVHHPKLVGIPKILETPWYKGVPLYKYEIEMLRKQKWFDVRHQLGLDEPKKD